MDDRERQLEIEGAQRSRVAAMAIAGGILYLIGQLILLVLISAKEPAVGILQGLSPALHGLKAAAVDPRAIDEHFLNKHAAENIVASVISALGLVAMVWPLRYLREAEVARSGRPSRVTAIVATWAAPTVAVGTIVLTISEVVGAHKFITHAVQNTAAYEAATGGAFRGSFDILYLLGYLGVAIAFVLIPLRAMRVGLLTRPIGIIGIMAGVLFILPVIPIPVLALLFLVGFGVTLLEVGGTVRPPAWDAGEAIPWVSPQRGPARGAAPARRRANKPATVPPAPKVSGAPSPSASKKRKRRRG